MAKQTRFDFQGDRLDALWRHLPEQARRATVEQYARLITRAAQGDSKKHKGTKP
jgi:hypothetical protein